jgi:deoxycytidine triphosphate deaminase
MILSHDAILAEVEAGNITIDPYDESAVGPASVDLRLKLVAGTRICQLIFERTEGSARYRGRFADQEEL